MSGAHTAADLKTATRVFDRIFRWQYHAIPLWRADEKWISYKSHIKKPARTPEIIFSLLDHWWADPQSHAGK
jgi:ABC-type oligopeptide transport system substrate-binding subunit